MKEEFHIDVTAEAKLADLLAEHSKLSKQSIKQAMQKGAVWLENNKGTHRVRRADKKVASGETLHFYYNEELLQQVPTKPELVSDQGDFSVWNKPSGMLSQGSKWSDHCTLSRWVETQYEFNNSEKRPCFVVHRLDKATQGLMVIAHSKKATQKLCKLFEERQVEKRYFAIAKGELPVKFNQHLDKEPTPKPILIESKVDGKFAKTYVNRIDYDISTKQSLLDIKIETGRKHQIRVHLSDYGYPVVGDRLYGNSNERDLQLQAYYLKLGEDQIFTLPNQLQFSD